MKIYLPYPSYYDVTREYLYEEITESRFHSVVLRVIHELDWYFLVNLPKPARTSSSNCNPIEAAQILQKAYDLLCKKLSELVTKYSTNMWLWYRRRLPDYIFSGELDTTLIYDSTLMDVCTGIWGNQRLMRESTLALNTIYPLRAYVIEDVMKACAYVIVLSDFHTWFRYAGKAVNFQYGHGPLRSLPAPVPTPEQEQAIHLYDKRVEQGNGYIGLGAGTILGKPVRQMEELKQLRKQQRPILMLVHRFHEPHRIPMALRLGAEAAEPKYHVDATYWPYIVSVAELRDFVGRMTHHLSPDWHEKIALLLLLLIEGFYDLHRTGNFGNLTRVGYYVVDKAGFIEVVDEFLPQLVGTIEQITDNAHLPTNASEVVAKLLSMTGEIWPVRPGPPIREEGNRLSIDLYMATMQLNDFLRFPTRGGAAANLRSRHFEDMVQEVIDLSSWKPRKSLAEYRRKVLRLGGRDITDIDAIGAKGKSLLCVSCKSLDYSPQYDAGDYREVRNATTTVEQAVVEWKGRIKFLRRNPMGDNYDFSQYSNIIGLVCTPHEVYVPFGVATEILIEPNLYAASSISEFKNWLDSVPTPIS